MTRQLLVTGAAGGMGRAICRQMGGTHELVLTDLHHDTLEAFASQLADEGYRIAGVHAGPLGNPDVLDEIDGGLDRTRPIILAHTAGIAASQGDWRAIMEVNVVATERLLRMVERVLAPGSVAVLIASAAGHAVPARAEFDDVLDDPLAPSFLESIGQGIAAMAARGGRLTAERISYHYSKRAVMRICQQRALPWGRKGARIVSISPGSIRTPMTVSELEANPTIGENARNSPAGRMGTPLEIAHAVRFLASEEASFISGCDLLVDGGLMGAMQSARKASAKG